MKYMLYFLGREDCGEDLRELVAVEEAVDESEMEEIMMEAVRLDILGREEYSDCKAYAFAPEQEPDGGYTIIGAAAPNGRGSNILLNYEVVEEDM